MEYQRLVPIIRTGLILAHANGGPGSGLQILRLGHVVPVSGWKCLSWFCILYDELKAELESLWRYCLVRDLEAIPALASVALVQIAKMPSLTAGSKDTVERQKR